MKNSNKTHSLEKNFKWPIAFSYFPHAPGRSEGQTLWLLLWRLNFILSGDLYWRLEYFATCFISMPLLWWTGELQHTPDEQGCWLKRCVCTLNLCKHKNYSLSAAIQTVPVLFLFLICTASIMFAWDSRSILFFSGMCIVNGRTDCPWPGHHSRATHLSRYALSHGCFVTGPDFRVGPHKAGYVKTKIMSFSV